MPFVIKTIPELPNEPEIITQLEQIVWWDGPETTIRACEADFYLAVEEIIR